MAYCIAMTGQVKDRYLDRLGYKSSPSDTNGTKLKQKSYINRNKDDGAGKQDLLVVEGSAEKKQIPLTLAEKVKLEQTEGLKKTWDRYKKDSKTEDRDELIVFYSPLVKYVASRVAAGLPQNVDQADLVSYGMFGLIDAINKFDVERGFKFETYAISRIKGSILDELRSIDWVPRSVRAKAKKIEKAMIKLETKLHRSPTDDEIADELDMTIEQLNGLYTQISSLGIVALDEMLTFDGAESFSYGDTLADKQEGPGKVYEQNEIRQLLASAINTMKEREKIVLTLYYYESLTLSEIGEVLNVTESRICQIHTKAVLQLRTRMKALQKEANYNV